MRTGRPSGRDGTKSKTMTIRLTPKMKFGIELASKLYRINEQEVVLRALSEFFAAGHSGFAIELPWAQGEGQNGPSAQTNILDLCWAERESDRFANMAMLLPSLLSKNEQRLWSEIRGCGEYWAEEFTGSNPEALVRDKLAEAWPKLMGIDELETKPVSEVLLSLVRDGWQQSGS